MQGSGDQNVKEGLPGAKANCVEVCAADKCKPTEDNNIPNDAEGWFMAQGAVKSKGCCRDRQGACDLCCPPREEKD